MNAEAAGLQLIAQHEQLRTRLASCALAARLFREGVLPADDLDEALETLRRELDAHQQTESTQIRKLLYGPAAWGSLLIDRMLEEHIAEHVALRTLMTGTSREIAGRIDELAEELAAHMDAEERTFLAPGTLRDEVLRLRTREDTE